MAIKFRCPNCEEKYEAKLEAAGKKCRCEKCGTIIIIPSPQKRRWLKNIIAVVLGIFGGFLVRQLILLPLNIFIYRDGLPYDLYMLLEIFVAFISGSIAGCFVTRSGWLFGISTQVTKIMFLLFFFLVPIIFNSSYNFETSLISSIFKIPYIRILIFAIISSGIAGYIGEKNRKNILSFLTNIFSIFGISIGWIISALGGLFYVYVIYLGGVAIFQEGAIGKGLLILVIIGPIVSSIGGIILYGIMALIIFALAKIYNWYAIDFDLKPLDF